MTVDQDADSTGLDRIRSGLGTIRTLLRGIVDRIDEGIARVPGNVAGIGVFVIGATLAVLLSGIRFEFPPQVFLFLNQSIQFVVFGLVLIGLNMQFGDTGIVNFGPVLFLAVGAYSMAIVTATDPAFGTGFGMHWIAGLGAGIVFAVLVGGIIGLTSLRLRDDYLAITTLAAAEIFHSVVRSFPGFFGGSKGISSLPNPVGSVAVNNHVRFLSVFLLFLGGLAVAYEGFRRLSHSPYGRVLRAILSDEDATRSVGKNPFVYKMQVFVYGAAVAGLGGGLMALFQGNAAPGAVTIDVTVLLWLGMMLGGPGNYRAVLGGLGLIMGFQVVFRQAKAFVPVSASKFNALRLLLLGFLFILIIRYRPAGIWGEGERLEVFK